MLKRIFIIFSFCQVCSAKCHSILHTAPLNVPGRKANLSLDFYHPEHHYCSMQCSSIAACKRFVFKSSLQSLFQNIFLKLNPCSVWCSQGLAWKGFSTKCNQDIFVSDVDLFTKLSKIEGKHHLTIFQTFDTILFYYSSAQFDISGYKPRCV